MQQGDDGTQREIPMEADGCIQPDEQHRAHSQQHRHSGKAAGEAGSNKVRLDDGNIVFAKRLLQRTQDIPLQGLVRHAVIRNLCADLEAAVCSKSNISGQVIPR